MNPDTQIENVMLAKGAAPFWVSSAMAYIRRLLTSNQYFTTSVNNIRVTVGKNGMIKSVTAKVVRTYPDDKACPNLEAKIKYTFNPNRKMAHKGWVSA